MNEQEWLKQYQGKLSERDLHLLARARQTLAGNTIDTPEAPWAPYRCISPWVNETTGIWNWDSAFHAMATSWFDIEQAKDCILGFIRFQKPDGMFPDVIYLNGNRVEDLTKPPVLPAAAWRVYEQGADKDFLRACYPAFVKNETFWTERRMHDGLFHYSSEGTPEEVAKNDYLHARYESGWDNSPRWDAPVVDFWPIDLNCFMVQFYRSLAKIATAIGEDGSAWTERANALKALVLARLYDKENNCFADYNFKEGRFSSVITPASFMPLYIGIATYAQAAAMHRIGADPKRFYPGMPSVSYDDPAYSTGYWRGPTWLNIAYFAAKGMKQYGFLGTANGIRDFILQMVDKNADGIYENYDSKEERGLYWHSFSWSACFVIEFILRW